MNSRILASFSSAVALSLLATSCGDQSTISTEPDTETASLAAATTAGSYLVEQNGDAFCVDALSTGETVEEFYDYRPPHSHTTTDIERSQVSNLFLFEGPNGTSLVALHDEPNDQHGTDTGGGAVTFDITGLPTASGSWVVQDDGEIGSTDTSPDWAWATRHTDGGAWRGGLDSSFTITIDPAFNSAAQRTPLNPGTIEEWHLLSGDANTPDRTLLDLNEPVTISSGCANVEIDIKPGSDPNAVNPRNRGKIPVAILHTDDFDPATVDVSTVRFGDPEDIDAGNGAAPAHNGHLEDVDKDGDDDLVLHFPTQDAGFEGDEKIGELVGETNDGDAIFGNDTVKLVGR